MKTLIEGQTMTSTEVGKIIAMTPRSANRFAERGELPGWFDAEVGEWRFDAEAMRARPLRKCSKCGKKRDAEFAYSRSSTCKTGRVSNCKICRNADEKRIREEKRARGQEVDAYRPETEMSLYNRNRERYETARAQPKYCGVRSCGARLNYDSVRLGETACGPCRRAGRKPEEAAA